MLNIEIVELRGNMLRYEVSSPDGVEVGEVLLDPCALACVQSILVERPFKPKSNEIYTQHIVAVSEGTGTPTKELVVEIRRGKSRVRRQFVIPKDAFISFWNVLHHRKLPSQIGAGKRVN